MAFRTKTTAALLGSLAAHVALAVAATLVHRLPRPPASDTATVDIELLPPESAPTPATAALEPPAPDAVTPEPPVAAAVRPASLGPVARVNAAVAPGGPSEPAPADNTPPAPVPQTAENGSSSSWSVPRVSPVNLGIGTYWRSIASSALPAPAPAEAAPAPAPEPPSGKTIDRMIRDGLAAHDRAIGLSNAGPLVSAAHEAASPDIAPDIGAATFDIDADASGHVIAAHVVSASAEAGAWDDVARELVRLMSSKVVRVGHDSRGTRTRLRIVAERTLPSGTPYTHGAGATNESDCAGKAIGPGGLGKKCGAGMPTGATQTFDLADIGAKASRVVRVQLLGEASL